MFEFSDINDEHNKKKNVIDLGLTSKNESIGYYIPQVNEIIYNKYKVIGLCGKGIFSSVFKVQDIQTNKLYSLKMIRNIDIMKLSGQKERQILSNLTTNSSQSKFNI
jgi:serine/threonine protein kinase